MTVQTALEDMVLDVLVQFEDAKDPDELERLVQTYPWLYEVYTAVRQGRIRDPWAKRHSDELRLYGSQMKNTRRSLCPR